MPYYWLLHAEVLTRVVVFDSVGGLLLLLVEAYGGSFLIFHTVFEVKCGTIRPYRTRNYKFLRTSYFLDDSPCSAFRYLFFYVCGVANAGTYRLVCEV